MPVVEVVPVVEATPAAQVKRLNPIKLKQMEDRLKFAEEEIPRLEQAITTAEERLGNFISVEQSQKDAAELEKLRSDRATLLEEWEELTMSLEEQRAV
jgi:ATP-binding cassette subfamily F protein 3